MCCSCFVLYNKMAYMFKSRSEIEFNIKLVKKIEEYPVLYDKTIESFSYRNEIDDAWQTVADHVDMAVPECKRRWMIIRAGMNRSLRDNEKRVGKIQKYYLAKHLQFLKPCLKNRKSCADDSDGESSSKTMDTSSMKNDVTSTLKTSTELGNLKSANESKMYENTSNASQSNEDSNESNTEELRNSKAKKHLKSKRRHMSPCTSAANSNDFLNNPDMCFLRSLLPDLNAMTSAQKNKFKIDVLQLIRETQEKGSNNSTITESQLPMEVLPQMEENYLTVGYLKTEHLE